MFDRRVSVDHPPTARVLHRLELNFFRRQRLPCPIAVAQSGCQLTQVQSRRALLSEAVIIPGMTILIQNLRVEREQFIQSRFESGSCPDMFRDLCCVFRMIATQLTRNHINANRFAQSANAKVERPQLLHVAGRNHGSGADCIADDDSRANSERFQCGSPFRKNNVVLSEQRFRPGAHLSNSPAQHI